MSLIKKSRRMRSVSVYRRRATSSQNDMCNHVRSIRLFSIRSRRETVAPLWTHRMSMARLHRRRLRTSHAPVVTSAVQQSHLHLSSTVELVVSISTIDVHLCQWPSIAELISNECGTLLSNGPGMTTPSDITSYTPPGYCRLSH